MRGSFDAAVAEIAARCGPVVATTAVDVAACYDARIAAPASVGTLLVLSFDAKGVVMRPEGGLREATREKAEVKGLGVYRTRRDTK